MDDANVIEMRRRIRTHMLMSFGGAMLGLVVMGIAGVVITTLAGSPPASWAGPATGIAFAFAILTIPTIGFYSTFTNLRCPACNGNVAFQVSTKYSAFGGFASNNCRHCGAQIFAPSAARRVLLLIAVVAAVAFFTAIGAASFLVNSHH